MALNDSVRSDEDLLEWAASFNLSPMESESMARFRQRFAHHMLTEYDDPVVAREITLAKPIYDWDVMERAEFVLDHQSFFERSPDSPNHRCYSNYMYCKTTAGHKVGVVMNRRTRRAGAVASNPAEFLTMDGTQAGDEFAEWNGRDPHWEGARLVDAPRGFEEALRKRQAIPTDDPEQGHLVVRHFDAHGKEEVKFIQPKVTVEEVDQSVVKVGGQVVLLTDGERERAETPDDPKSAPVGPGSEGVDR